MNSAVTGVLGYSPDIRNKLVDLWKNYTNNRQVPTLTHVTPRPHQAYSAVTAVTGYGISHNKMYLCIWHFLIIILLRFITADFCWWKKKCTFSHTSLTATLQCPARALGMESSYWSITTFSQAMVSVKRQITHLNYCVFLTETSSASHEIILYKCS